jgi:hypothetical protein
VGILVTPLADFATSHLWSGSYLLIVLPSSTGQRFVNPPGCEATLIHELAPIIASLVAYKQ